MLGSLILYLKGMRRMMFQLSGFYWVCVVFMHSGSSSLGLRVASTPFEWCFSL